MRDLKDAQEIKFTGLGDCWVKGGGRQRRSQNDSWFLSDITGWARVKIQTLAYSFLNTPYVHKLCSHSSLPVKHHPQLSPRWKPILHQSYLQCHLSHEAVTENSPFTPECEYWSILLLSPICFYPPHSSSIMQISCFPLMSASWW